MKEALDKDEAQAVVITDVEQEIIRANVLLMKYINDDDGSTIQRPQDRGFVRYPLYFYLC